MGEVGGGFHYNHLIAGPGDVEAELVGADAKGGIGRQRLRQPECGRKTGVKGVKP